jgi:hypothetical protein
MSFADFFKPKQDVRDEPARQEHKHPRIRVGTRQDALEYAQTGFAEKTLVISIRDRGVDPIPFLGTRNMMMYVPLSFDNTLDAYGMSQQDAKEIASAIHCSPNVDCIFINSECGHVRSASVAAAIERYFTGTNIEFVTGETYTINERCVKLTYAALYGRSAS